MTDAHGCEFIPFNIKTTFDFPNVKIDEFVDSIDLGDYNIVKLQTISRYC